MDVAFNTDNNVEGSTGLVTSHAAHGQSNYTRKLLFMQRDGMGSPHCSTRDKLVSLRQP